MSVIEKGACTQTGPSAPATSLGLEGELSKLFPYEYKESLAGSLVFALGF